MKQSLSNQTIKIVRQHDAVDLLLNLKAARNLAPFMTKEQTLGSAAAELDRKPSSVAYWVNRFLQAGLLAVVREQPRAGKSIPYYRATADEFQVPFEAMPKGAREEFLHGARKVMMNEFAVAVERVARTHYSEGLRVSGHPTSGMSISFIEPKERGSSPVTEWWGKVALTKAEAEELQREMESLIARFDNEQPGRGRSRYLIMAGIAPAKR